MKSKEAICVGAILLLSAGIFIYSILPSCQDSKTPKIIEVDEKPDSTDPTGGSKTPDQEIAFAKRVDSPNNEASNPRSDLKRPQPVFKPTGESEIETDAYATLDMGFLSKSMTQASKRLDLSAVEARDNPFETWSYKGVNQFQVLDTQEAEKVGIRAEVVRAAVPGATSQTKVVTVVANPGGEIGLSPESEGQSFITSNRYLTLNAEEEKELLGLINSGDEEKLVTYLAAVMQAGVEGK